MPKLGKIKTISLMDIVDLLKKAEVDVREEYWSGMLEDRNVYIKVPRSGGLGEIRGIKKIERKGDDIIVVVR